MKSFAYIRPKQGVSLDQQIREIERYSGRHRLQISQWFIEDGGRSAIGPRPVFSRMIRGLKAKKAFAVLTDTRDRFTRAVSDWTQLSELAEAGVRFYFSGDRTPRMSRASLGMKKFWRVHCYIVDQYLASIQESN